MGELNNGTKDVQEKSEVMLKKDNKKEVKTDKVEDKNILQKKLDDFKDKERENKRKKNEKWNRIVGKITQIPFIYPALCFAVSIVTSILTVKLLSPNFQKIQETSSAIDDDKTFSSQNQNNTQFSVVSIAERNIKSIAEIHAEMAGNSKLSSKYSASGEGSGIVVSSDGYIMTNNHVISGAEKIDVTINGETFDADLVGSDSEFDLALIKIDKQDLQPVIFGDSENIQLTEGVIAIGNPFGKQGGAVTQGIISSLEREVTVNNETMTLLQTDASVDPKNSGGGLFNFRGELIGMVITRSKSASTDGISFAIPVNNLKKPLNDLKEFGYIRGKIDIEMQTSNATSLKSSSLYHYNTGVVVTDVPDNSNAQAAGFQNGDCIISIGSEGVSDKTSLNKILKNYFAGDIVPVEIMRKEEPITLTLQFAEKR